MVDSFTRLVAATVCASIAFALWDLVARNPSDIVRDVSAGVRQPRSLVRGLIRLGVGFALVFLALALAQSVFFDRHDFSYGAIAIFLAALGVDALIGDAFRSGVGIARD